MRQRVESAQHSAVFLYSVHVVDVANVTRGSSIGRIASAHARIAFTLTDEPCRTRKGSFYRGFLGLLIATVLITRSQLVRAYGAAM